MSTFSELFKKAHGAISSLRGANSYFLGKDGDIVYSKNNVCVHETKEIPGNDDDVSHIPGYLTIHCLHDEHLGATLVLQWLPNKTLEKNPASIRCVSPRSRNKESRENGTAAHKPTTSAAVAESDEDESLSLITTTSIEDEGASRASTEICVEVNGDMITVSAAPQDRPTTLEENGFGGLGVPQINVIPNTPIDHRSMEDYDGSPVQNDAHSDSSGATSGADDMSDKEDQAHNSSSCDESEAEEKKPVGGTTVPEPYRQNYVAMLSTTPEQFAKDHNLMLESSTPDDPSVVALSKERVIFQQKSSNASLFSVNLGKMRSMRLFYSNPEYTSGQLVITSPDSQYKILHFHHGGLDKLAQLFEQWNAVKAKSMKEDSPSPVPDRHLVVFHPEVSRDELDPEEGLYDGVGWDLWKSYMNKDGSIDDSFTIRKTVYFAAIEPSLRKEIWPFLLHMYPWNSTFEQREAIRNDLFLEYQNIKKKRMRKMNSGLKNMFLEIESSVWKDVVRTDRKTEYFAGDDNPNLEIMKDILMAYAATHQEIGYIQGMSDLLAPLMTVLQNEADAYWCFVGLMQKTLFACSPSSENNMMEVNLDYLRELMKVFVPDFFKYLAALGEDALKLLFVHRWLLLFFKREFPQADSLNMWEACWAKPYLHLFICIAIIKTYSPDIMGLRAGHDEVLLYFASIANHIDANVIMKLARGLMYRFCRMEKIPCTLAGLFDQEQPREQWTNHISVRNFECVRVHGNHEPCPFANA